MFLVKKNELNRLIASFMLIIIGIAIIPFSAFHKHHYNICDVASSTPIQFKKEKDVAKEHLHQYEKQCFLCIQSHVQLYSLVTAYEGFVDHLCIAQYTPSEIHYDFISRSDLSSRAPPVIV